MYFKLPVSATHWDDFPWLSTAAFKAYFAANQTKAVYVWLMESFDQIIGGDQLNNVTD